MNTLLEKPHLRALISIDNVIFGFKQGQLKILLVNYELHKGKWALPGGYVFESENILDAANRLLLQLSGIKNLYLQQFKTFGAVGRVPGERVLTVAYLALISLDQYPLESGEHTKEVRWFDVSSGDGASKSQNPIPVNLLFDHKEILDVALAQLKHKVRHEPIGFNLLPAKFTLLQLQELYEAILGVKLDKPNFRRKMSRMKLLLPLGEKQQNVAHRAAELYRFDPEVYERLKEQGFVFEV